jgi:hypothetical protein
MATSSVTRPTTTGVKSAASGVVADAKKRLSAVTGSHSAQPKTAARSGPGPTATTRDAEALRARITELEAENDALKGDRPINGHAEVTNDEIESKNQEIEELKAKVKDGEERVSFLRC